MNTRLSGWIQFPSAEKIFCNQALPAAQPPILHHQLIVLLFIYLPVCQSVLVILYRPFIHAQFLRFCTAWRNLSWRSSTDKKALIGLRECHMTCGLGPVLLCLALILFSHQLNRIVSLFSSQDTIAIKKRSSRTRRIRPVSTRLSEYRCISSHPPLSPRFLLSSDPILSFSRLH